MCNIIAFRPIVDKKIMIITKMKEKNAEQPFVIRAFCYVHQDTSGINEIGTEKGHIWL